jgi:hypothetical protein
MLQIAEDRNIEKGFIASMMSSRILPLDVGHSQENQSQKPQSQPIASKPLEVQPGAAAEKPNQCPK